MPSSSDSPLLLLAAIAPCLIVAAAALVVVPHFREVYSVMGAELPAVTRLLFATFRWWSLFALVPVAAWMLRGSRPNRALVAILAGVATAAVLTGCGVMSCYAPLFALGRVVG